jgi:hypothetical protein
MTQSYLTDAKFAAALAAGRTDAETEIRVQAVRYVADRDAIEVVMTCRAGFLIPRGWIGALQDVSIDELGQLEIWPDGSAIELESRDIHISVDGLMTAVLPAMPPTQALATVFASRRMR